MANPRIGLTGSPESRNAIRGSLSAVSGSIDLAVTLGMALVLGGALLKSQSRIASTIEHQWRLLAEQDEAPLTCTDSYSSIKLPGLIDIPCLPLRLDHDAPSSASRLPPAFCHLLRQLEPIPTTELGDFACD